MMKSNNTLIAQSLMFFFLAIALALTLWPDVSLAARIGMFLFGFASGVTAGAWLAKRND